MEGRRRGHGAARNKNQQATPICRTQGNAPLQHDNQQSTINQQTKTNAKQKPPPTENKRKRPSRTRLSQLVAAGGGTGGDCICVWVSVGVCAGERPTQESSETRRYRRRVRRARERGCSNRDIRRLERVPDVHTYTQRFRTKSEIIW